MRHIRTLEPGEAAQYSPLTLAYLGDAVYELLVREYLVLEGNRPPGALHKMAVRLVQAKSQSDAVERILPELGPEEAVVFKRGRNAKGPPAPKNAGVRDYRMATGLEALIGYLYLTGDMERISDIFGRIVGQGESDCEKGG